MTRQMISSANTRPEASTVRKRAKFAVSGCLALFAVCMVGGAQAEEL